MSLTANVAASYKPSIALFVDLIEEAYGDTVRFNEMKGRPERFDSYTQQWVPWDDSDDAQMAAYFQTNFNLYAPRMLVDAVRLFFRRHTENPLVDLLNSLKWDGQPRMERFLIDTVGCEDSEYNREVSRLIFAGGIHRALRPGCKFDDVIVLVGRQGGGKSTLVRWLNMEDQYFGEIKTITGKEATEALSGVWIGEIAELMAMTRVKEVEAVKAFITSQEDSYRAPYDKHTKIIPRRCIFIGTTNNPQFLSDKTGNRRFYPVTCSETGFDLFDREQEIRDNIRQCWAEAMEMYRQGKLDPHMRRDLLQLVQSKQEDAVEDDWRVGAIEDYLKSKTQPNATVCLIELWHRALNQPEEVKPTRSDSIELGKIMNSMQGWEKTNNSIQVNPWGKQKTYRKTIAKYFPF